jgi:hypothetical protein
VYVRDLVNPRVIAWCVLMVEQRVTAKDPSVKDSTERLFEFDGVLDDKMGQPALFDQV